MREQIYMALEDSSPFFATGLSVGSSRLDFGPLMNSEEFSLAAEGVLLAQARFFSHLNDRGYLSDSESLYAQSMEIAFNLFQQFNHNAEIFERGQGPFRLFLTEEELLERWSQKLSAFKTKLVAYLQSNEGSNDPFYIELSRWLEESTDLIEAFDPFFNLGLNPTVISFQGESPSNFQERVQRAIHERRARWDSLNLQRFAVRSLSR